MLQPLQLQEVSTRYAMEIAELRDFLAKAGCTMERPSSLGAVVARLQQDRAFRRDLTSQMWAVIDTRNTHNRQISLSDLLGVLALAAAGPEFSAAAEDDDAHNLLRFLMDVRRSLEQAPTEREEIPVRPVPPPAVDTAEPRQPAIVNKVSSSPAVPDVALHRAVPSPRVGFSSLDTLENERTSGRPMLWAAVAIACLLLMLSTGLWLHHSRSGSSAPTLPAPTTAGSSTPMASRADTATGSDRRESTTASASPFERSLRLKSSRPIASRPQALSPRASRVMAPPVEEHWAPPLLARAAPPQGLAAAPPSAAVPAVSTIASRTGTSPVSAGSVPSAKLSKLLGSPTLSADAYTQDDASPAGQKGPRLLRRHSADNMNLVAEVDPAEMPSVPAAGFSGNIPASAGTVRATSLGIMAGNVLYSPSPAYPAAASAAHVQGEVTIQADVDRDGNVASARVISGPPLLRDAALDAVQRWHFRPYLTGGKPSSMGAMAIMDFQLP